MPTAAQIDAAMMAMKSTYDSHVIGTLTSGNTPVSVYRVAQGEEYPVFGPTDLISCEDWLRREAATAALVAAEQSQ